MIALLLLVLSVEVRFSQTDGCLSRIIELIRGAQNEILVAMYSFTSRPISEELAKAKRRGIDVKVIVDHHNLESRFSKLRFLRKRGVPTRVVSHPPIRFIKPKMHHKFMVVDRKVVFTGSYNFTASAERYNDENCIFISGSEEIVSKFVREFFRLWKVAR